MLVHFSIIYSLLLVMHLAYCWFCGASDRLSNKRCFKPANEIRFFRQLSTIALSLGIKYSKRELICDVNYCVICKAAISVI